MKTTITCERYRDGLVDEETGLADPSVRLALEKHRAECPECAAEAQRDALLCSALRSMPDEAPPVVTWQQVLAVQRPARVRNRVTRLTLGSAVTAAALAGLLIFQPFRHQAPPGQVGTTPPPTTVTVAAESAPFAGAHSMVSASNMTGDPNRDVILLYGALPAAKGGS